MDRREAIELLKPFRNSMVDQYGCPISDVVFALDIAIKALGQEPSEDCISRADLIEKLKDHKALFMKAWNNDFSIMADIDKSRVDELDNCISVVMNAPSVTPTDKIVDFNNMISADDRIRNLPPITPKEMTLEEWQELDRAIQGDAESATTTDCISRADAIAYIDRLINSGLGKNKSLDYIRKYISALPSAETHEIRTETHGVCLDCISRQQAVEAVEKHAKIFGEHSCPDEFTFGAVDGLLRAKELLEYLPPVTPTEQNEEDILKFYYVESLDEYWIGQRCGTRYYGKWTGNCFTFGYSRYLPWGEHVVAPNTLWKEHTYPSEPKEIPFNEWLQGFLEKERQTERTGEWIVYPLKDEGRVELECPECGYALIRAADRRPHFCENCGARMMGGDTE